MNKIRSAFLTVLNRCAATTTVVFPFLSKRVLRIARSLLASNDEVASSRNRMSGDFEQESSFHTGGQSFGHTSDRNQSVPVDDSI